jgi:Raf kinase inhibitor-like YbhB/YbcL family protein
MLENVPHAIGEALRGVRAGFGKIVAENAAFAAVPRRIVLASPAFDHEGAIPRRYTRDGEGLSPPLTWRRLPPGVSDLVLIVEDPDAPTLQPLVHLMAWGLSPREHGIAEGCFSANRPVAGCCGRNSFFRSAYLPPDPPNGHGPHHYVFQIFALDAPPDLAEGAGRTAVIDAMRNHVVATGELIGTYER